ncbi:MAG TPA: roadblock/LC7 domain-containing protein [Methanoregulaceae archaeon]|nr:roadblock/LC7 domain-containing protein [Methanoregulaceae archaeon]
MLKSVLHRFFNIPGVKTVLIIRSDGHIIEDVESGDIDDDRLAAVTSFVMAESQVLAKQLGQPKISMIFIEFREILLSSIPLKDDLFLVVITTPAANIGQINYELKKNMEIICSYL